MKYLFYTVFIALVNNLNNFGVRIAYSLRGIKITTFKNLWISVITFFISTSAAFSGELMSRLFSKNSSSVISMILLTVIGLWIIVEPYMKKDSDASKKGVHDADSKSIWHVFLNPEHADMDNSKNIDFNEARVLGIALSLNNIGGGLGAGLIGLNSWLVGLLSAVISFLALWAGNVTEFFMKWKLGNAANIIAGVVLIAIGIEQVL